MSLFDIVYAKVHVYPGGCRAVALRMRDMGFPNMTEDVLQKKSAQLAIRIIFAWMNFWL